MPIPPSSVNIAEGVKRSELEYEVDATAEIFGVEFNASHEKCSVIFHPGIQY